MPPSAPQNAPVLKVEYAQRINFASAQNSVPVIRRIEIENPSGELLTDLTLRLTAYPSFCRDKQWTIDQIGPNDSISLSDRNLTFDYPVLGGLDEAEKGQLTLTLVRHDQFLVEEILPIELLAKDEWGGLSEMAQILAAFVSPNHSTIATLAKSAAKILAESGHNSALDGYQSKDPSRAYMLTAAVWSAVTGMGLTYAEPPKSFEQTGQKIRDPGRIADEALATCLDTALLISAALEAVGLNPVIIFTRGHAFVGVWLVSKTLPNVIEPDVTELRKAIAAREFIVFEATMVTSRPPSDFKQAISAGREHLNKTKEIDFDQAVDIARARSASIRPLASHQVAAESANANDPIAPVPLPPLPDFGLLPGELVDEVPSGPEGRIQRWQRKLLDLSLRNRLLNFRTSKQTLPLLCPDVPGLEDLLADEQSLRIISLEDENPVGDRDPDVFRQATGKDIHIEYATEAMARKQVCVPLGGRDMGGRLTTLYRKAKSDLSEGGTNTLFLAAGFLKWKKAPTDKRSYRAPLLLLPVTLKRKSAKSDYYLAGHEDEPQINATLLQFLKRDFDLTIPALEGKLPEDKSGIDLPLIFEIVRAAVREVPGFEVVEETAISTFSFAKYLMWKDLVDRTDQLRQNRLVRHLIDNPDTPFAEGDGGLPSPHEIDRRLAPADLLTPLPADSSQLSAVVAAADGKDFVVIGPPGTGKSQTIANMIAHCLAKGKSVLFVAEKSAALDVVHRRLKAHGLGDVCLELHSNKADRKRVLAQLGEAWDRATTNTNREWINITSELRVHRDKLNAYVEALHMPGSHGVSVFEAISIVVGKDTPFSLSFSGPQSHDHERLDAIFTTAEKAGRAHAHINGCEGFSAIGQDDWSFAWQAELLLKAEAVLGIIQPLRNHHRKLIAELGLEIDSIISRQTLDALACFAAIVKTTASRDYSAANDPSFNHFSPGLEKLRVALDTIETARAKLSLGYLDQEILRMPLEDLDRDWREAVVKCWPLSFFGKRRTRKLLESYGPSGRADPAVDLSLLGTIQSNLQIIETSPCTAIPGFEGVKTNTASLEKWISEANEFRKSTKRLRTHSANGDGFEAAITSLLSPDADELPLGQTIEAFAQSKEKFTTALSSYQSHIAGEFDGATVENIETEITATLSRKSRLVDWTKWIAARNAAKALGLTSLVEALEAGTVKDRDTEQSTRVAYFTWWLPLAMDASEELRAFVHWDHSDRIDKFRELDEAVQKLTSAQVRARLSHGLPAKDGVPRRSELGTLRHQVGLQRPSMAIRQLITEMPSTFTKLTPCVLMSPLSVAQYLPANHAQFDMVIFDEASQITTWDAIGAIARGRQSIIVGDPKQLPPTNFFGRANDDDDDDLEIFEKDLPSILEEAVTAGLPTHQLNWHYRSRDEALIAFSNHHYYNGRLVTFPSPKTESDALVLHKIDGTYARGKGRTNEDEARAIVAFATQRMKEWLELPEAERLTVGVITFNAQQQELILDLLDAERRESPELEWFFDEEREEPTIVKNLENIQGDERDVMLFSITFGPDQAGALTMNFGAINNPGGEKRLNVAVTRARAELHIYASITADQIDLNRTNFIGVSHLKNFLDYAERGAIALPAMDLGSLGPTESPFEDAVVNSLEAMGWQLRTQVGVSHFRIDIGVVHPDHAGAYLAGVECDGATYHRSASARDRDKIREAVLRNLGWEIVRIWSTDWFMNPKEAALRTDSELKKILQASRESAIEQTSQDKAPLS